MIITMITCLLPVCNESAKILSLSIESILSQSYKRFILLIIVDNPGNLEAISTIKNFASEDKRVKFVINESNIGLANALNLGIEMTNTKYIARMDADDISLPKRFEHQVDFLEKNPLIDLVGAFCINIDDEGHDIRDKIARPCNANEIKSCMRYFNVFAHPTLMGKTSLFKKMKYRDLKYSQDYDFTCRCIEKGFILENIPEKLLRYRVAAKKSPQKAVEQMVTFCTVQKYYRKSVLCKKNISEIVKSRMQNVNVEKNAIAIEEGVLALNFVRSKHYIKGVMLFIKCIIKSKYQCKYMLDILFYSVIRKIYNPEYIMVTDLKTKVDK